MWRRHTFPIWQVRVPAVFISQTLGATVAAALGMGEAVRATTRFNIFRS